MGELDLPKCFWCNKPIKPGELAVKFPCPSCGRITIWRCEKCRVLAKPYKCPLCGFIGP